MTDTKQTKAPCGSLILNSDHFKVDGKTISLVDKIIKDTGNSSTESPTIDLTDINNKITNLTQTITTLQSNLTDLEHQVSEIDVGYQTKSFRYSTEEQLTDKLSWDGKPVYTKTFQYGQNSASQKAVDLNIDNLDVIWIAEANYVINNMNTTVLPWVVLTPTGEMNALVCYIHDKGGKLVSEWLRDEDYVSTGTIRVIVEYTKTTDPIDMGLVQESDN